MTKPVISIVVCTYNRSRLVLNCLTSLDNQILDKDQYEVVIVDNNSTDDTQKVVGKFIEDKPNFYLVFEGRQGHAHARNCGWHQAKGDYIAYTDDDTRVEPDWCQKILKAFLSVSPQPVAVGGQIYPWYEAPPPDWFSDEMEIRTWGNEAGFLQPPRARYGFSGANMSFKRDILQKYGGFSTDYGIVDGKLRMGEDTELFFRVYDHEPFFWYDPEIRVQHWVPVSTMTLWYQIKRSYLAGIANARIHGEKYTSEEHRRMWKDYLRDVCRDIFDLTWLSRDRAKILLKKGEKQASRLGFLIGTKENGFI